MQHTVKELEMVLKAMNAALNDQKLSIEEKTALTKHFVGMMAEVTKAISDNKKITLAK